MDLAKLDSAKIVRNNVHSKNGPRNDGSATIVSTIMELATIDPGSLDNGLRNNGFGKIDTASKISQQ